MRMDGYLRSRTALCGGMDTESTMVFVRCGACCIVFWCRRQCLLDSGLVNEWLGRSASSSELVVLCSPVLVL